MASDQLILKELFFFSILKGHFTDKQASSLQNYVELSVMLEYNSRSKCIYDFIFEMRRLCSYDC